MSALPLSSPPALIGASAKPFAPDSQRKPTFPSQFKLYSAHSRLASAKLAFNPYTVAQLKEIVHQRLKDGNAEKLFDPLGIEFACRKVGGRGLCACTS